MATIEQNLQKLVTAKTDIRNAILQMGGTCPSSHGFEEFDDDILTISSYKPDITPLTESFSKTFSFAGNGYNPVSSTDNGFFLQVDDIFIMTGKAINYYLDENKYNYNLQISIHILVKGLTSRSSSVTFHPNLSINLGSYQSSSSNFDLFSSPPYSNGFTPPTSTSYQKLIEEDLVFSWTSVPVIDSSSQIGLACSCSQGLQAGRGDLQITISNISAELIPK